MKWLLINKKYVEHIKTLIKIDTTFWDLIDVKECLDRKKYKIYKKYLYFMNIKSNHKHIIKQKKNLRI